MDRLGWCIKVNIPFFFTIRGAIIVKIWTHILLVTIYTALLVCISNYVEGWKINFPQTLIPILGFVTGLLLSHRTNSSYSRFWEGKTVWSTMTFNIRTLARCIWVMVEETEEEKENTSCRIIEKVSAINVLVAFVYATKNYLRGDSSYEKGILKHLINHIPKLFPLSNYEENNYQKLDIGSTDDETTMQNIKAKYDMRYSTNLPLELSYHIAAYIKDVHKRQLAPDFTITLMNNSLTNMVQCLGGLERISTTSTPLTYAIHLFQLTYIFILALPFQLIGPLNWYAIPTVALAAFSLLGIYVIGLENENAFWQEDILPFKYFCNELHEEILSITSHPMPTPKSWLLSTETQPFATTYLNQGRRTPASQLIKRKEDELRKTLKEAGRQVPLRRHLYKERKEEEKRKISRIANLVPFLQQVRCLKEKTKSSSHDSP